MTNQLHISLGSVTSPDTCIDARLVAEMTSATAVVHLYISDGRKSMSMMLDDRGWEELKMIVAAGEKKMAELAKGSVRVSLDGFKMAGFGLPRDLSDLIDDV